MQNAVERVGSEKIFFGTDTYACAVQAGRIKFTRISEKDKENFFIIMQKNISKSSSKPFRVEGFGNKNEEV